MFNFAWETALLLIASYLVGSLVGCFLRKLFKKHSGATASVDATDRSLIGGSDVAVAGAAATAATGLAASVAAEPAEEEASIEINRGGAATAPAPAPEPAPAPMAGRIYEREEITIHEREIAAPVSTPAAPVAEVTAGAAVAAAATADLYQEEEMVDAAAIQPPDDLTQIKGIGLPVALELKKLGVTHFHQVANWTEADIARVSQQLGFSGRIERENWMDQARILAEGDDLKFTTEQLSDIETARSAGGSMEGGAAHVQAGVSEASTTTVHTETVREEIQFASNTGEGAMDLSASAAAGVAALAAGATASAGASGAPAEGDDLKRIKGIGSNIEVSLKSLGYTTFRDIAQWSPADIDRVSTELDIPGRIERERWVHQARLLANV